MTGYPWDIADTPVRCPMLDRPLVGLIFFADFAGSDFRTPVRPTDFPAR
jgi:hypothetical protein